jgi:hypothetical protein
VGSIKVPHMHPKTAISSGAAQVAMILTAVATTSCTPHPVACEVMTLDRTDTFDVLSRYGRSSFDTDCATPVPKEVLVKGEGYGVYILLRANTPAQAFIGVRPHGSSRFELRGQSLKKDSPQSAFRDRATHNVRLPWLPDGQLEFQVLDRENGTLHSHSFKVGEVGCTCKLYDGP